MLPDSEIANQPNKYAPASGFDQQGNVIRMDGYQAFELDVKSMEITPRTKGLRAKAGLMRKYFTPKYFHGRTFLDLGGNNGYYSLKALTCGATAATVVDMDTAPIHNLGLLNAACPQIPIKGIAGNVADCKEPADVVIALALIHWIYNLTTGLGSLDKAVGFLAGLAREALIVEWVDAQDEVIVTHHHVKVDDADGKNPYTREEFLSQLRSRFAVVRSIGKVSSTREIYLACGHEFLNIDKRWAEPVMDFPEHKHVATREITTGLWSRLYLGASTYYKQANLSVGRNELEILASLQHPAIPQAAMVQEQGESLVFSVSRLPGQNLDELSEQEPLSFEVVEGIARQLSAVLVYLKTQGVQHRDVQPGNVIYDPATKAVGLIDFGWASGPGSQPLELPATLGYRTDFQGREAAKAPSDLFAFGSLLSWMLRGRAHPLAHVALYCQSGQADEQVVAEICNYRAQDILGVLCANPPISHTVLQELTRQQTAVSDLALTHAGRHTWLPAGDLALCETSIAKLHEQAEQLHKKINKLEEDKTKLKKKLAKATKQTEKGKKRGFFSRLFGKG